MTLHTKSCLSSYGNNHNWDIHTLATTLKHLITLIISLQWHLSIRLIDNTVIVVNSQFFELMCLRQVSSFGQEPDCCRWTNGSEHLQNGSFGGAMRELSEDTMHPSLLHMWLHDAYQSELTLLTLLPKVLTLLMLEQRTGSWCGWSWPGLIHLAFFYLMWAAMECVCGLPGKEMAAGFTEERNKVVRGNVKLCTMFLRAVMWLLLWHFSSS